MSSKHLLGYTSEEYAEFRKYSWLYLASFSLLCACANCCRMNLSAALPVMAEEGWTASQLGVATGIFFWVYAIGQIINGRLSEIVGSKILLVWASLFTGITCFAIGFQSSITAIAVLWGINGLFQSMIWAPGLRGLNNWWQGERKGFATGFAHAFNGLGQGLCMLVVSISFVIMPQVGWKSAFWIPAVLPVIAAFAFALLAKDKPEKVGLKAYEEMNAVRADREKQLEEIRNSHGNAYPFAYLLKTPAFAPWLIMAFLIGIARYGLLTWIPYYYVDRFDVSISSGLVSTFVIPLGMAVGTLVVPWLTDIFCPDNRMPAVLFCGVGATITVIVFFFIGPGFAAKVMLFFAGFFIYAINGMLWALASDIGGRVFSGTASGMLNFASYLGAGCQAAVFGFIVDAWGWDLMFVTIAVGLLIIVALAIVTGNRRCLAK